MPSIRDRIPDTYSSGAPILPNSERLSLNTLALPNRSRVKVKSLVPGLPEALALPDLPPLLPFPPKAPSSPTSRARVFHASTSRPPTPSPRSSALVPDPKVGLTSNPTSTPNCSFPFPSTRRSKSRLFQSLAVFPPLRRREPSACLSTTLLWTLAMRRAMSLPKSSN